MRCLWGALLLSAPSLVWGAPAREMRGLWVVRTALVSPQSVDRVVDQASEAGLNALFVQVRGRGDAFYDSKLVARSVLLENQPATFDPLARLLERARARGLEVHAWVNVLLTAHFGQPLPAGHVVAEHPEWVMVPRSASRAALSVAPKALPWLVLRTARSEGDAEGYYLSPSAAGVAEHLEGVVRELVRGYAVDGLHLDFIRYPGPEYDYSRAALEAFEKLHGGGDLLAGPSASPAAWNDYRRETLTGLVDRLVRAARYERPGLVVSAAVVADETQAIGQKYQSWPAWLSQRLLDAVCPMAYTPDSRVFRQQVERARSVAAAGQVWAGVGAYRLALDGVIEKIRAAREAGASGVVLFSHESLAPHDWKRLREMAFPPLVAAAAESGGSGGARSSPR